MATINGGPENNSFIGGDADDIISGNGGDDFIRGDDGADTLDGGEGDDTLYSLLSTADTTLDRDKLSGGGGNDVLAIGYGDDADGGTGTDKLYLNLSAAPTGVTLDTAVFSNVQPLTLGGGLIKNIEKLVQLTGTSFADTLTLTVDETTVDAGGGDDLVIARSTGGNHVINGGSGVDTFGFMFHDAVGVNYSFAGAPTDGSTFAVTSTFFGTFTISGFERFQLTGTSNDDTLTGSSGSDTLIGGLGADKLNGGGGNDRIEGGDGADILDGGAGDNYIDGGAGDDVITNLGGTSVLLGGEGADEIRVQSGVNVSADGGLGNDKLYFKASAPGTENVTLNGGEGADQFFLDFTTTANLTGTVEANGDAGDDVFSLSQGRFRLSGGAGKDTYALQADYFVGPDLAKVSVYTIRDFTAGNSGDVIDLSKAFTGGTNPFVTGKLKLMQSGANTVVRLTEGSTVYDLFILQNVKAIDLTAVNFGGLDPQGPTAGVGGQTLVGTTGPDTLKGGAENDTLTGGDGNDTLVGGRGADKLDGGSGWDVASYTTSGEAIDIDLTRAAQVGGDAQGDVLIGIETISGSPFNDILAGDDQVNVLVGDRGDDLINGRGGADVLYGGDDNDKVIGGQGADQIDGGAGDDILLGGGYNGTTFESDLSADVIEGGAGNDTAGLDLRSATAAIVFSNAGSGVHTVTIGGVAGAKVSNVENLALAGGSAGDTLTGGGGKNVLWGYGGDDKLTGGASDDILRGGVGNDSLKGEGGNDRLEGGDGADILDGGAGDNYIDGGAGDDLITNLGGKSTLLGGEGADTIHVLGGVNVDAEGGTENDTLYFQGANVTYAVLNGGDGDDKFVLTRGSAANVGGLVEANGGAGDDVFNLSSGKFALSGGTGKDTYALQADYAFGADATKYSTYTIHDFTAGASGDVIDLSKAFAGQADVFTNGTLKLVQDGADTRVRLTIAGQPAYDLFILKGVTAGSLTASNFGGLTLTSGGATSGGTSGPDTLTGGPGPDMLSGLGDADMLIGGAGNDTLDGGDGDDFLIGGAGSDKLIGGAGTDTAVFTFDAATAGITLSLAFVPLNGPTFTIADGQGGVDEITGVEQFAIIGTNFADTLTGSYGNDLLVGGLGADTLKGLYGDDYILGGGFDGTTFTPDLSADIIDGGGGDDTAGLDLRSATQAIVFSNAGAGEHIVTVGGVAGAKVSNVENLYLAGGSAGDTITGGDGKNVLWGYGGDDKLTGGAADDILRGGVGADTLKGEGGNDRLEGGDGNDTLDGGAGDNYIDGGAGDDLITNLGGKSLLLGGDGADEIRVSGGDQLRAEGDAGNDKIYFQASSGVVKSLILNGGEGADQFFLDYVSAANLSGTVEANGGAGDDVFNLSGGRFLLSGGAGKDTYVLQANYAFGSDATKHSAYTIRDFTVGTAGDIIDLSKAFTGGTNPFTTGALKLIQDGANTRVQLTPTTGAAYDLFILQNVKATDLTSTNFGGLTPTVVGGGGSTTPTEGPDTLTGTTGADMLNGLGGDDFVIGGAGADILDGGAGNDTVFSGDRVVGTQIPAPDMGLEHDVLSGGAGDDFLAIGYGDDADGGTGTDRLSLSFGGKKSGITFTTADIISGQPFTLDGGTIKNIEAVAFLRGSEFNDILTLATQSTSLSVDAGAGNDVIYGSKSAVSVFGGAGNDRFVGGSSPSTFNGGDGDDTIDYSNATAGVTVNLATQSSSAGDQLQSVERATGSKFADTLVGSAGANVLKGGSGDDIIRDSDGNDVFEGGAGADQFFLDYGAATNLTGQVQASGGSGDDVFNLGGGRFLLTGDAGKDTYVVQANYAANVDPAKKTNYTITDFVVGSGGDVIDLSKAFTGGTNPFATGALKLIQDGANTRVQLTPATGAAYDLFILQNVKAIDLTSANFGGLDPTATSGPSNTPTEGPDTLSGTSGADTLNGLGGDDTLNGLGGDDVLIGGLGADKLDGGDGVDTAHYGASNAAVTVNLTLTTAQSGGHAAGDVLLGVENLIGSAFDDKLTGNDQANALNGGAGADTLSGGAGNDVLIGGAGADNLDGGAGIDTVDYSGSSAAVKVDLNLSLQYRGDASGDTLTSIENIIGSAFDDLLTGNQFVNVIDGGAGNDRISGGSGADNLTGGLGADTFAYSSATLSGVGPGLRDIINDFSHSQGDLIDVSALAGDFKFLGTGAFTGTAHEISYAVSGGDTIVSFDANGDGTVDFQVQLLGVHNLVSTDFLL